MCGCEATFVCRRCAARWPLDLDPYHTDWREDELEQHETAVSQVDFKSPFREQP